MKWAKWGLVSVLVIAAVIVFSAKVLQKRQTYYYYPEWNTYYDVKRKNYIYSINGGKTWDTITNSSNVVASTLGEKIVVHSSSAEIWKDNAEHRQQYGGELNDLVRIFLQSGEDKRMRKKSITGENSKTEKIKTDSTNRDSTHEIEQWIHESTIQGNTAKDKKENEEETKPLVDEAENTIIITTDSTEL
jgi:hypothetical protein